MTDIKYIKRLSSKGFTLIELAIVLVIVGLLVGIGSGMVGVLTTAIKVRETRDTLDANMQAINSWASANNKLPSASAGFGNFSSIAKSRQDAWGREFIYLYETNLAPAAATKDSICGRRSTTLAVNTADPAATINNVAFVLISKSDDANLQTTASDGAITVNRAATGTISTDPNNSDLIRWVTLDELRSKMGCQGAPLKIVNNELPYGYYSTSYAAGGAVVTPDGGTGDYKWRVKSKSRPTGISFIPSITFNNISASDWSSTYSTLKISGLPRPSGSYSLTIQVKDNSENIAEKPFVMTINPASQ